MPTYRTSARNQFRTPLGAVGDPPDVPGYLSTFSDDLDNILGVGGAEYCATTLDSVPPGRKFKGKMAYHAPSDVTYRYVGSGGTALGANGGAAVWQAWEKPAAAFTPAFSAGITGTPSSSQSLWGISSGLIWVSLWAQWSTTPFTLTGGTDAAVNTPSAIVGNAFGGSGMWLQTGGSGNGQTIDLMGWSAGSGSQFRIRARTIAAATGGTPVRDYQIAAVGAVAAAGDVINMFLQGPSGLVY